MAKTLIDQIDEAVKSWGPFCVKYINSQWHIARTDGSPLHIALEELLFMTMVEDTTARVLLQEWKDAADRAYEASCDAQGIPR